MLKKSRNRNTNAAADKGNESAEDKDTTRGKNILNLDEHTLNKVSLFFQPPNSKLTHSVDSNTGLLKILDREGLLAQIPLVEPTPPTYQTISSGEGLGHFVDLQNGSIDENNIATIRELIDSKLSYLFVTDAYPECYIVIFRCCPELLCREDLPKFFPPRELRSQDEADTIYRGEAHLRQILDDHTTTTEQKIGFLRDFSPEFMVGG